MKEYTEEMRMNGEYPQVGEKVILNILPGAFDGGKRGYNGSEIILVDYVAGRAPLFYCVDHEFTVVLNSAHFKAIPPKKVETETPEEASEFDHIEMVDRISNEAEDWPKVGDDAVYKTSKLPVSKSKCTLSDYCVVDTWDNLDPLKVIAITTIYGTVTPVVQNKRTEEVSSILLDLISKPKTPEQILTGKVESLIADSLKESNFTGDIGLGDMASIITSNLELYFKVSDL